jgi:hypothetical protein
MALLKQRFFVGTSPSQIRSLNARVPTRRVQCAAVIPTLCGCRCCLILYNHTLPCTVSAQLALKLIRRLRGCDRYTAADCVDLQYVFDACCTFSGQ